MKTIPSLREYYSEFECLDLSAAESECFDLFNNCLELKRSSGFHLEHLQKYIATFRNIFRNVTLPLGSHSETYVRISIVFPCSVFTADKPVRVFKKLDTLLLSLLFIVIFSLFLLFIILHCSYHGFCCHYRCCCCFHRFCFHSCHSAQCYLHCCHDVIASVVDIINVNSLVGIHNVNFTCGYLNSI